MFFIIFSWAENFYQPNKFSSSKTQHPNPYSNNTSPSQFSGNPMQMPQAGDGVNSPQFASQQQNRRMCPQSPKIIINQPLNDTGGGSVSNVINKKIEEVMNLKFNQLVQKYKRDEETGKER